MSNLQRVRPLLSGTGPHRQYDSGSGGCGAEPGAAYQHAETPQQTNQTVRACYYNATGPGLSTNNSFTACRGSFSFFHAAMTASTTVAPFTSSTFFPQHLHMLMYSAYLLTKKPGLIPLRLRRGPHSATRTHCLCRQANSGHHCHLSSMYSPHTHRKTSCSLGILLPVVF